MYLTSSTGAPTPGWTLFNQQYLAGAPTPGWTLFNQQYLAGAPTPGWTIFIQLFLHCKLHPEHLIRFPVSLSSKLPLKIP